MQVTRNLGGNHLNLTRFKVCREDGRQAVDGHLNHKRLQNIAIVHSWHLNCLVVVVISFLLEILLQERVGFSLLGANTDKKVLHVQNTTRIESQTPSRFQSRSVESHLQALNAE